MAEEIINQIQHYGRFSRPNCIALIFTLQSCLRMRKFIVVNIARMRLYSGIIAYRKSHDFINETLGGCDGIRLPKHILFTKQAKGMFVMTQISPSFIKHLEITQQTASIHTFNELVVFHYDFRKSSANSGQIRVSINSMKVMNKTTIKPKWIKKLLGCWRPVWITWHNYLRLTTIPGLQSVHNAQGKVFTAAWSILFAIGLACTIRDVYISWLDYLAYPVTTAMNLQQAASLPFPAVTVCNLNRVHCGNLRRLVRRNLGTGLGDELERLYEVTNCRNIRRRPRSDKAYKGHKNSDIRAQMQENNLNEPNNDIIEPDNEYNRHPNNIISQGILHNISSNRVLSRNLTTESTILTTSNGEDDDGEPLINQTQSFNELMNFMALYANFSEELRIVMGHDAERFIRACTFSGKSCSNITLFFKTISSTSYGNCFTFNTMRRTVIPGKDYGLSLELFLDQANYIGGGLSPRAGARVVVHSSAQHALPNENGLTVPPHTATSIALTQVEFTKEKLPYVTNCTSGWERTWYETRVHGAYKYSMEQCQRVCLQFAFEDVCSCTHPNYMDISSGISPCNLTSDNPNYGCVSRVLEEFEFTTRTCSCNMDCSEIRYEMKMSQAAWPNDNNWCEVAQRFGMARSCKFEGYHTEYGIHEKELALQNVLTIDVFFENLRIQSIYQQPTYKLQSFVGSLGGALSLYLGVTLFMLIEVLEVFVRLLFALLRYSCCSIYQRRCTAARNKNRANPTPRGIYYTDFRFKPTQLPRSKQFQRPTKFVW